MSNGQYAALTRYDRETNAVCFSDTLGHWGRAVTFQMPEWDWEVVQLGNCGSPIETSAGWLVLTHAVGPMRTYSIGAVLLDLDDPTKMIAALKEPLLTASAEEQDGYVPNVVYTCGAMAHGDVLVIPYGVADHRINFATASIKRALEGDDRERPSDDRRQGPSSSHRGPSPRALSRRDLRSWVSVRRSRCRSDGA